jgi:hypothetical protein
MKKSSEITVNKPGDKLQVEIKDESMEKTIIKMEQRITDLDIIIAVILKDISQIKGTEQRTTEDIIAEYVLLTDDEKSEILTNIGGEIIGNI